MRGVVAGLAVLASVTFVRPTTAQKSAATRVEDVLARWEARCVATNAVEARFTLVKRSPRWELEQNFEGTALIVRPDRIDVTLDLVTGSGKKTRRAFDHRVVGDGRRLYMISAPTKQLFVYESGSTDVQPLLQSDVIGLLFNMKAETLLAGYRVTSVKETQTAHYLQLFPKQARQGPSAGFARLDLVLEKSTLLPTFLRIVAPGGDDTQTFRFSRCRLNPPVPADAFRPPHTLKGWSLVDMSLPDRPKAGAASSETAPAVPTVYSQPAGQPDRP